ncbi:hypothetical protein OIDMADRAFT_19650 [Oidiodendron maius Zn]|uniref:Uncharacterized protein n=1 Tax=Oidiodendron maius (strain Zn) TaxID=913774 RepID=A0A0C3H890_OIDMZ|nr:hypothetical protein OIDMADRAFT_19650 [Oidiodendron maius Zn]
MDTISYALFHNMPRDSDPACAFPSVRELSFESALLLPLLFSNPHSGKIIYIQ